MSIGLITLISVSENSVFAPKAARHSDVARMSFEPAQKHFIFTGSGHNEAQINSLCTSDFDEIACIVPESLAPAGIVIYDMKKSFRLDLF